MQIQVGNIWGLATPLDYIVITTNIGWKKADGEGIMGAGLAAQAKRRAPWLPRLWGRHCQQYRAATTLQVVLMPEQACCHAMILLPTKPLNESSPWTSWYSNSSLPLIIRGLLHLEQVAQKLVPADSPRRILVPMLGCQNGHLAPEVVEPLILQYLQHPCFVLVKRT